MKKKKKNQAYCCLCGKNIVNPTSEDKSENKNEWEAYICKTHSEKEIETYTEAKTIPYCSICGMQECKHIPESLTNLHININKTLRDRFTDFNKKNGRDVRQIIADFMKLWLGIREPRVDEFIIMLQQKIHNYQHPKDICGSCKTLQEVYTYTQSGSPICNECFQEYNDQDQE